MPSEALKSLLNEEEVEITATTFKEQFQEMYSEIEKGIIKQFGQNFVLFEVRRPSKGLVHPVLTLEVQNSHQKSTYYAVRFFEKNEEQYRSEEYFDRSRFYGGRIKKLIALGRFYPSISIIDLNQGIIVLQEFIFAPICKFDSNKSIDELIELIFIASEHGLFLDFNQNHFLYGQDQLYYVDKEYSDEYDSFEETVYQNFNQTTLFLNAENQSFFTNTLKAYYTSSNQQKQSFVEVIKNQLIEKKKILEKRDPTELIKTRLTLYNNLITGLDNQ